MSAIRKRLDAVEEAIFRNMSDEELEAFVANGPDLSDVTDDELQALVDGTADPELLARYQQLEAEAEARA